MQRAPTLEEPQGRYIDTFIFKTVEWCNLDCTYCYYYHGQDTSFKRRPRFMSRDVMERTVAEIVNHCSAHLVPEAHVTLHGGEPLLQDLEDFEFLMKLIDEASRILPRIRMKVTTNGVLLNQGWAERLVNHGVHIGVSIDGPPSIHDRYRLDLAGRGSSGRVERGLAAAYSAAGERPLVGTITVLQPSHDGEELYRYLRSLGSRNLNLVLPEHNYINPPPATEDGRHVGHVLEQVYGAWLAEGDEGVAIRLLSDMVRALAGAQFASDQFGTAPIRVAVIETDGSIEPTDNFRACAEGMSDLGLNVSTHGFDALVEHPFFALCLNESPKPPMECAGCQFLDVCEGGRITTRYSHDDGFSRKSVHCEALYHAFSVVEASLREQGLVTRVRRSS